MKFVRRSLIALCLLLSPMLGLAQEAGNPINSADAQFFDNHGIDSVNLQSLAVNISVPVISKPGAIPFSFSLDGISSCVRISSPYPPIHTYAECGISPVKSYDSVSYNYDLYGTSSIDNETIQGTSWKLGYNHKTSGTCAADNYATTYTYTGLYLISPSFETYALPVNDTMVAEGAPGGSKTSCAVSLSDYTTIGGLHVSFSTAQALNITFPNGSVATGTGLQATGKVTDAFGNSLSSSGGVYTDTLNNSTFTISPFTSSSPGSYTWKDTTGTAQSITESFYAPQTVLTNFGCSNLIDSTYTNQNLLSEIQYPDGTSVSFAYEAITGGVTGRLSQLTLRTGGTVNYTYGAPIVCGSLLPSTLSRTTQDGTTTYSMVLTTNGTTTTVLDPGKNKAVYTFVGTDASGIPLQGTPLVLTEVQKWQNTGTVSSPVYTLLTTDLYCYNGNTTSCSTTEPQYPIIQKDSYHTENSMSTSSRTSVTYDTYGNVTSVAKYDFGASSFTIKTTTTYGSWNGTSCVAVGNGIINKPCDVVTTDGTHTLAETRYTYSAKGFPTTISQWTGSTWLSASASPNSNGTAATSTDPNGTVTTNTYAATGSGGCNGLLLTGTSAIVSGVTLTTGNTWDCNGGMVLSSTDTSGNTTSYAYDELFRKTSITDPTTFAVNRSYTANSSTVSDSFDALATTTTVDGLGRAVLTQTTAGTQYNTASASFGYVGPNWTVNPSYPCLQSLGQTCVAGDTDKLDPLGRPITVVGSNGGTSTYAYNQNDVQVTLSPAPSGEHNKVSQTEYDGLGRVKSSCAIETSGGTTCGQVDGGSGILTSNSYSFGAGSSTVVSTRGSQTRTTVSDALGRSMSVTTPETGSTTSIYDTVSAADNCYAANAHSYGNLMHVTKADGSYLCYLYDGLHRLTDVSNNTGGSTNVCKRFRYDSTSTGVQTNPTGYNPQGSNIGGRLMEAETDNCTGWPNVSAITDEWFAYDADGRVTDVWELTPHSAGYYHTTVGYYNNGQVYTLSGLPGYSTYTIGVDSDGRPLSSSLGSVTIVKSLTRDGANRPLNITFGNGSDYDTYAYNPNGTMASYSFLAGSLTDNGTLTWNPNNTLQTLVIADGFNSADSQTCTFSYDDIARLLTDNCGASLWSQTYSYDQHDNLTKTGNPGTTWNPGYSTSNNHITGANYDGRGDITYDLNNTYTWDLYGKLSSASPGTASAVCGTSYYCYTYDALGRLVEKSSNTTYSEVLYSPLGRTAIMSGATTVSNALLPTPGGGSAYFNGAGGSGQRGINHFDWLGSNRLQTALNSTNAYMDTAYTPYGEMYATSGTANSPPRQMFTGDFTDTYSTALYDTPNREFDFGSGSRWLSPDPAGAGWNLYAYSTNPSSNTDPTGLEGGCRPWHCGDAADAASVEGSGINLEFSLSSETIDSNPPGVDEEAAIWGRQEDYCIGCSDYMTDEQIAEIVAQSLEASGQWPSSAGGAMSGASSSWESPAEISQSYYIPRVPGSGINGVANWVNDNVSLWSHLAHDQEDQCEMCGPSLHTVLATYYRGGSSFKPKPGELKINPDGTVKTTRGISINLDPAEVEQYGGAYEIKSLPSGLKIIQQGKNLNHYEIVSAEEGRTEEEVLDLLDKIVSAPVE